MMYVALLLFLLPTAYSLCYWNNSNPYRYFGCKTFYNDVRGDINEVPLLEGCDVISVWMIMRHGVRYPNQRNMDAMKLAMAFKDVIIKNHALGKGQLCDQDILHLKQWSWNNNLNTHVSDITMEGYKEIREFAERFQYKFSTFLKNLDDYTLRPTKEIRTINSAKAFVDGLEGMNKKYIVDAPLRNDKIARPYRYCKRREMDVIKALQDEERQLQKSPDFINALQEMKNRTGISELLPSTLIAFYNLCRYNRAASPNKRDAWCSLFSDKQLQTIEYINDIKHYFSNGYGNKVNIKLGELGLKDLYENFNKASSSNRTLTGYFTHAAMIDMIYSALGLFNDTVVGRKKVKKRMWRKSFETPFAANFIAVLYRCQGNTRKVQFIVNEKEIHTCKSNYCTWREFQKKFKPFLNSNYKFCDDLTWNH